MSDESMDTGGNKIDRLTGHLCAADLVPTEMDEKVQQYIWMRDKLKEMDKKHKEDCQEFKDIQEKLAGAMQLFLDKTGSTSVKTRYGTFYSSTHYTASLVDPDIFMRYIQDNNMFELLDRRANSTAVKDYLTEHNALPPGCNLNAITTVGVRRA